MRFAVLGTSFVDIKGLPTINYVPEGCSFGKVATVQGGVGRNIACDLANLGTDVTFISTVDDSLLADGILITLEKLGIDTENIQRAENGLGIWMAMFNEGFNVTNSVAQRPDMTALIPLLKDKAEEIVSSCDCVIAEIDMNINILQIIYDEVRRQNKRIYGAVSSIRVAMNNYELIKQFDMLIINKGEAEVMMKKELPEETLEKEVDEFRKKENISSIIVTNGGKGAVFSSERETGTVITEETEPVDTTGAGDSFLAAAVIGIENGMTIRKSCEIAEKIAA
ncbi:MAG: hypothetical protein IJM15_07235, partial [Erysipelotrichaceae bacterium]|nr:hypothetical protein [Erysipelotrichaceae bacterium]